jgi:hypothetical protein
MPALGSGQQAVVGMILQYRFRIDEVLARMADDDNASRLANYPALRPGKVAGRSALSSCLFQ